MAEQPPPPPPPSQPPPPPPSSPPPPSVSNNPDTTEYWCYQCNKRVPVETLPDQTDIICFECKNGFVESINARRVTEDEEEETPAFGSEFVQILRLIAQAAREDDEPPPPPSDHPAGDNDYLRIELDGWGNESIDEDEEDPHQRDRPRARFDDNDVERLQEINNQNEEVEEEDEDDNINDDDDDDDDDDSNNINDDDDLVRRYRRDALRLQLRGFARRAAGRRSRILDWAEILTQLEEQSIEFRLQATGDDDVFIGNPGDYVDAAGYEALLQTLADSDTGGRRGAPPASKSAVEGLRTVEVESTDCEICAVCKDSVFNNEGKIVKQLECGHMYHGDCIVQWLSLKNSCPVCRFELPTDDPEYEEDRKKRSVTATASTADHGCSSSSGGAD